MSGETSDISQFCEFAFYDWIMFRDQPVAFPDDNPVLGQYLGPAINVGPVLAAKIFKANGEVVYWLTYRPLTDGERTNAAHVLRRVKFDQNIQDKFGPETSPDDFLDLNIPDTPEHNNFDDVDYAGQDEEWEKRWCTFTGDGLADGLTGDADDKPPTPSLGVDGELPTPEADDNYVNASLMPPRGNTLVCGTVIGRKHDAQGNPIGNANTNPILDSRVYRVEFEGGNMCELTANVIVESMYASCDADGNKYILFDSFVDHQSNWKAVMRKYARAERRVTLPPPKHET